MDKFVEKFIGKVRDKSEEKIAEEFIKKFVEKFINIFIDKLNKQRIHKYFLNKARISPINKHLYVHFCKKRWVQQ